MTWSPAGDEIGAGVGRTAGGVPLLHSLHNRDDRERLVRVRRPDGRLLAELVLHTPGSPVIGTFNVPQADASSWAPATPIVGEVVVETWEE